MMELSARDVLRDRLDPLETCLAITFGMFILLLLLGASPQFIT
tara:strand:- start:2004 stop:2132 length:129 start_codon:yes stop_codon:yes gene_type:complete